MQDAQQHIRVPLRVVGEYDVAIPLEFTVDPAEKNDRHLYMRMPMGVAHVASLVDQDMIQNASTIAIGNLAQFVGKGGQVLHMVPVHLCIVGYVLRLVAVM